jgi:ferredoxin
MADLTLLTKLFATFSAETPAVNDGLCLNRRFKAANCDLCVQACPVAAISVYGPNVQIEPEACVHCGICLKECPTGVFSTPRQMQDDQKLLDAAAPLTARALELTCPTNVHADKTAAPVEAVLQTGRCLAALSLGELLDLARPRQRNLWLNDSGCAGCPLGKAAPLIHETAAHANRLLESWRYTVKLRTQRAEPGALVTSHRVDLFSGQQPSYSRREFLTFLRRTTAQVVSAVAVDPLAPPDMTIVPPLQRGDEVPYQRRHLTAALSRLGQPSAPALDVTDLPWVTVEVSAQCSACSLCARFCPTAAIRWTTHAQAAATPDAAPSTAFDLSFIAADCVDCGICAAACPEAAITYSAAVDPTQLGRRVKVSLRSGQLNPCAVCQTLTDTSLRPTCYVCNKSLTKTISN